MSKLIGTKMVEIDGEMVECKVFSTRKIPGANTFNQKMKVKGKDALRQRAGRKTDMPMRPYVEKPDIQLPKQHRGTRMNRSNLVFSAGDEG